MLDGESSSSVRKVWRRAEALGAEDIAANSPSKRRRHDVHLKQSSPEKGFKFLCRGPLSRALFARPQSGGAPSPPTCQNSPHKDCAATWLTDGISTLFASAPSTPAVFVPSPAHVHESCGLPPAQRRQSRQCNEVEKEHASGRDGSANGRAVKPAFIPSYNPICFGFFAKKSCSPQWPSANFTKCLSPVLPTHIPLVAQRLSVADEQASLMSIFREAAGDGSVVVTHSSQLQMTDLHDGSTR